MASNKANRVLSGDQFRWDEMMTIDIGDLDQVRLEIEQRYSGILISNQTGELGGIFRMALMR